ncbi:MAG: peptidoglycan-associated lipoprotein Pal [Mariprofundaceae bacterium]
MRSIFFNKSGMLTVVAMSCGLLFAGCAKQTEPQPQPSVEHEHTVAVDRTTVAKPSSNSVYFAFDSAELDSSAQATLDAYARWLKSNAHAKITIEGNCDERGSREYNLALGQQRANSVRHYLTDRGVAAGNVDTVSFGEERAVCQGTGEACWAQNRHADIVSN